VSLPPIVRPPVFLERAARRLNPCLELEADLLAVERAALACTPSDWGAQGASVTVEPSGAVRLAELTGWSIFKPAPSFLNATDLYAWEFTGNPKEILFLDFWPDPLRFGPGGFTLKSLDVILGRKKGSVVAGVFDPAGVFRFSFWTFDDRWNRVAIADPIDVPASAFGLGATPYTLDLWGRGRRIAFDPGAQRTATGVGRTGAGNPRTADVDANGVSHLVVTRGLSIGIEPIGNGAAGAFMAVFPNATAPYFDRETFWRRGSDERVCGPYDPGADGPDALDGNKNPGDQSLSTGAVPGYGAIATTATVGGVATGQWGISRQTTKAGSPQAGEYGWAQPYHDLKAVLYQPSGTLVTVLDLGAVPTREVHFRADDAVPVGASVAYSLEGSNDASAWTALGAVTDGAIVAQAFRYYRVTATLTAGAGQWTTPTVQAIAITERTRFSTMRYTEAFDTSATIDPVTGQSEIAELKLPLLKLGPADARDLASRIASDYAPTRLEAWVYATNTVTGERWFLNAFRLEDREPSEEAEALVFVSGMDRLKVMIPQKATTFAYPATGYAAVAARSLAGLVATITVNPAPAESVNGMRYVGASGVLDGKSFVVSQGAPGTTFTITLEDAGQLPAVGDLFRITSDTTARVPKTYAGVDFATIYQDVRDNLAALPARFRGTLPPATGRLGSNTLDADGREALEVLQELALLCGGAMAWDRGRLEFVDLYGEKDCAAVWSDADLETLTTPLGAARRMPSLTVKYGWDSGLAAFTNEATYEDANALEGWGRANLFDAVSLPDELCKWNDATAADYLGRTLLKAWSTGVRLWKATTVTPWPWLRHGHAVGVFSRGYTDRRLAFTGDGVTDAGTPVRGPVSAVGVIVGKNLEGTEFLLAIRGLDAITSVSAAPGTVDPTIPATPIDCPDIVVTFDTEANDYDATPALVVTFTPPDHPRFDFLEFLVSADGGPDRLAAIASGSPVRLAAAWNTAYTVTPVVHTTDGATTVGTPVLLTTPKGRRISPEVPVLDPANPGGPVLGYPMAGADTTGRKFRPDTIDNTGREVRRFFGKPTVGDPDTADAIASGVARRIPVVGATDATGNINLGGSGWVNKHAGNLPRSSGNATPVGTVVGQLSDAGHAASGMQDSGGREVRRFFGKSSAGDPDNLDSAADGSTYKRTTANEKTGAARGFVAIDGSNELAETALGRAKVYTAGAKPSVIVARKSSSDGGSTTIVGGRLLALGYAVTYNFAATVAQCRGYDVVALDASAWSADEFNAFLRDLLKDGQRVLVLGNDSTTGLFYITSTTLRGNGSAKFTKTGRPHPVHAGWSGSLLEGDGGTIITGYLPRCVPLLDYTDATSGAILGAAALMLADPAGGVLVHCHPGDTVAGGSATGDRILVNLVEYLGGGMLRQFEGSTAATHVLDTDGVRTDASVAGATALELARRGHGVFLETFENAIDTTWTQWIGSGVESIVAGAGVAGGKVYQAVGSRGRYFPYNIPFDPSKLYRMRVRVRRTVAATDPTQERFYCGVIAFLADGVTPINTIGTNTTSAQHTVAASGANLNAKALGEWVEYTGWFKGHGTSGFVSQNSPLTASPLYTGAAYFRPGFLINYATGNGTAQIDYIAVDVFDEAAQARLYTAIAGDGNLKDTVKQSDGVTARVLAKGHVSGQARNNDNVSFPFNYQNPPLVVFRGGILHEPRARWGTTGNGFSEFGAYDTAKPTYDDTVALNLTTSGFALRARLRQKAASSTPQAVNGPSGNTLAVVGQTAAAALVSAPVGAVADQYTLHYWVHLSLTSTGEVDRGTLAVTVAIDSSSDGGSNFTERAAFTYTATTHGPGTDAPSWNSEAKVLTVSGLSSDTPADKFRLRIKTISLNGQYDSYSVAVHLFNTGNGDAVAGLTYNVATDSYASRTPDTDDAVAWEALEVS
jgi:hypothetical protein